MLRHQVIAQNVANVNTPGYHRLDVAFEDQLKEVMHAGGSPLKVQPRVVAGTGGTERPDGNNVDIDQEMGELTKNALLFNAFSQLLTSRIGQMRSAISGR